MREFEWGDCETCAEALDRAEGRTSLVIAHDRLPRLAMRMYVCPTCGNKRCPKAALHTNACTGSNEPGQLGSRY